MLLTGLALPYRQGLAFEATNESPKHISEFLHGSCRSSIQQNYIEVIVNGIWKEHLASTKHGLTLSGDVCGRVLQCGASGYAVCSEYL